VLSQGDRMAKVEGTRFISFFIIGMLAATVSAQNFGAAKTKAVLQRKLPALAQLTGTTFKVKVTGHDNQSDLTHDLEALLETELLKDDPHLRADETDASTVITCQITDYAHPPPTVTAKPSLAMGKNAPKTQAYTRVTGSLSVAFQAKSAGGKTLISDHVSAKYDEEFDSSGNSASHGVKGAMTDTWKRLKGDSADLNPPTDAELRAKLIDQVVHKIAEHIVNTNETLEVYLAKGKGALDEGDKQAEAGLWQRALETFETAPPSSKPVEDAYRLYDIGVAYEALAYAAGDAKSAMKFLDEAAINYGKAIDAKPAEKYFLEPQRRIETAISHYKELEESQHQREQAEEEAGHPKSIAPATPGGKPSAGTAAKTAKALTNAQVIAMVKAGMDDDAVVQAVRASRAANFDLSVSGQQQLTSSGVSARILTAMKTRSTRKP